MTGDNRRTKISWGFGVLPKVEFSSRKPAVRPMWFFRISYRVFDTPSVGRSMGDAEERRGVFLCGGHARYNLGCLVQGSKVGSEVLTTGLWPALCGPAAAKLN